MAHSKERPGRGASMAGRQGGARRLIAGLRVTRQVVPSWPGLVAHKLPRSGCGMRRSSIGFLVSVARAN